MSIALFTSLTSAPVADYASLTPATDTHGEVRVEHGTAFRHFFKDLGTPYDGSTHVNYATAYAGNVLVAREIVPLPYSKTIIDIGILFPPIPDQSEVLGIHANLQDCNKNILISPTVLHINMDGFARIMKDIWRDRRVTAHPVTKAFFDKLVEVDDRAKRIKPIPFSQPHFTLAQNLCPTQSLKPQAFAENTTAIAIFSAAYDELTKLIHGSRELISASRTELLKYVDIALQSFEHIGIPKLSSEAALLQS